jgi:hypothetical protein
LRLILCLKIEFVSQFWGSRHYRHIEAIESGVTAGVVGLQGFQLVHRVVSMWPCGARLARSIVRLPVFRALEAGDDGEGGKDAVPEGVPAGDGFAGGGAGSAAAHGFLLSTLLR